MFRKLIATDNDSSSLVLRLMLATVIMPHGAQKLLGWFGGPGFFGTLEFFATQMAVPPYLTLLVIFFEFIGSVCLLVGFLTRLMAAGIFVIMSVAIWLVHWQNGFFMNWFGQKQGEGFEFHLLAIAITLALMIKGGGLLSADRIIQLKLQAK